VPASNKLAKAMPMLRRMAAGLDSVAATERLAGDDLPNEVMCISVFF